MRIAYNWFCLSIDQLIQLVCRERTWKGLAKRKVSLFHTVFFFWLPLSSWCRIHRHQSLAEWRDAGYGQMRCISCMWLSWIDTIMAQRFVAPDHLMVGQPQPGVGWNERTESSTKRHKNLTQRKARKGKPFCSHLPTHLDAWLAWKKGTQVKPWALRTVSASAQQQTQWVVFFSKADAFAASQYYVLCPKCIRSGGLTKD